MNGVITECPAVGSPEAEVEETDSLVISGKVADILDVPVNTYKGWANFEELSLLRIVWDWYAIPDIDQYLIEELSKLQIILPSLLSN